MSPSFDQVFQAALALPEAERVQLVDSLIASFPTEVDSPLDERWTQEIARRSAEIDAGTADLVPWEQVRKEIADRQRRDV